MINYQKIIGDIRFWIILFFLFRLYGITDPPLEVAHNWRQTTVTMAARNFFETDPDILYPRIDIVGEKSGIAGMEFPLLNYLIYLVSLVFGYAHWYGRLINLIVSSVGLFYFYKLVLKYFDRGLAFNATFILLFSVWFNYSRKIMPDTFSVSLVLMGMYYGTNYLDRAKTVKNAILFFVFTFAGILSKLPAAYFFIAFLFLIADKKIELRRKVMFSLASAVVCGLTALYYFYWVPHLVDTFGCDHFFMGKSMANGGKDLIANFPAVAARFYEEALEYSGFIFLILGVITALINKNRLLLAICGLLTAGFLVILLKAGSVFSQHAYYIVPFVPVMATLAGYGVQQIASKKIVWCILTIIAIENIANRFSDYHINPNNQEIYYLEQDLDKFSGRKDLIIVNSGNVPTPMYFAHRRGWVAGNAEISDTSYIGGLKEKGLKYIVILKKAFGEDVLLNYTLVFDNHAYRIYKI